MNPTIAISRLLVSALAVCPLMGQWISYPTSGVPQRRRVSPSHAACPRTADGKPDLSGLWIMQTKREGNPNFPGCEAVSDEFVNIAATLKGGLPYRPWAADLVKARLAEQRVNDPLSRCIPIGPVRLHTWNGPRKVMGGGGLLVIMNELGTTYRQIFTDGRPLPADPNPSWNGYSSGKWEGDTLVVHSAGFRDHLWLDATGNPMTDAAKLTERFHRPNFGHMDIELTVDDPKAYTEPWTVTLHQVIQLNTDLLEFVCGDNEKDSSHLSSN